MQASPSPKTSQPDGKREQTTVSSAGLRGDARRDLLPEVGTLESL